MRVTVRHDVLELEKLYIHELRCDDVSRQTSSGFSSSHTFPGSIHLIPASWRCLKWSALEQEGVKKKIDCGYPHYLILPLMKCFHPLFHSFNICFSPQYLLVNLMSLHGFLFSGSVPKIFSSRCDFSSVSFQQYIKLRIINKKDKKNNYAEKRRKR